VETRGMRVDDEARTTMAIIAMPDEHTAEFVFYRTPGADLRLTTGELDADLLGQTRALQLGSLSLVDEPARSATFKAVEFAREGGALISFDINYRPSLWRSPEEALVQIRRMVPMVDLIKVNEVEVRLLQGEGDTAVTAASLLDQGPTVCVLTRGAAGSSVYWAEETVVVPAFEVPTVDATGCGDAFVAGLLTQLTRTADWRQNLSEHTMRRILRYANAVAALTAQTKGVIPALPTAVQVDAFLFLQPRDWRSVNH
jgi:fructokinase